jgi:hypothetical protein
MGGEAVVATVDFGDRQCDALTGRRAEHAPGQGGIEPEIAFQSGRAVGERAEHVRHAAEQRLDGGKADLSGGRRGFDR